MEINFNNVVGLDEFESKVEWFESEIAEHEWIPRLHKKIEHVSDEANFKGE